MGGGTRAAAGFLHAHVPRSGARERPTRRCPRMRSFPMTVWKSMLRPIWTRESGHESRAHARGSRRVRAHGGGDRQLRRRPHRAIANCCRRFCEAAREHALAAVRADLRSASGMRSSRRNARRVCFRTQGERCTLHGARRESKMFSSCPSRGPFSRWTPAEFVERVLAKAFHAQAVMVGENFRFGHHQAGNTRVLADLGSHFGFETHMVSPVKLRGRVVSSSEIRRAIEAGKVGAGGRLLGRPYASRARWCRDTESARSKPCRR